jgi:hypothetical protein
MATSKKPAGEPSHDLIALETRKVRALEKIATSLEDLSMWIVDVDKDEWSDRIQHYLYEFLKQTKNSNLNVDAEVRGNSSLPE